MSSKASYLPVLATEGTEALDNPPFVNTSASTVGFPLESRISLDLIFIILELIPLPKD
jgi:hypothetical protein